MKLSPTVLSARAAAVLVATVAGAASYEHIASVALRAGEREWVAYSLPLAIDGLIVVGVAALLEDKSQNLRARMSARVAVVVGVLATLAANLASAEPTTTARLVAVTAPVSFLLAIEVLTRRGKAMKAQAKPAIQKDRPSPSPRTPIRSNGHKRAADKVAVVLAKYPDATQAEVAKRAGVSTRTVRRAISERKEQQ